MALQLKQKRFVDEYLITANATQAAIKAGYSKKYAGENADKILKNTNVKNYLDERLKELEDSKVADAKEVIEYLTRVLRGESTAEVVVVEGVRKGVTKHVRVEKAPDEKEKLKAAELLGKRYGIFKETIDVDGVVPVVISGGEKLED